MGGQVVNVGAAINHTVVSLGVTQGETIVTPGVPQGPVIVNTIPGISTSGVRITGMGVAPMVPPVGMGVSGYGTSMGYGGYEGNMGMAITSNIASGMAASMGANGYNGYSNYNNGYGLTQTPAVVTNVNLDGSVVETPVVVTNKS